MRLSQPWNQRHRGAMEAEDPSSGIGNALPEARQNLTSFAL